MVAPPSPPPWYYVLGGMVGSKVGKYVLCRYIEVGRYTGDTYHAIDATAYLLHILIIGRSDKPLKNNWMVQVFLLHTPVIGGSDEPLKNYWRVQQAPPKYKIISNYFK